MLFHKLVQASSLGGGPVQAVTVPVQALQRRRWQRLPDVFCS